MRDITGDPSDHATSGWSEGDRWQEILNARPIPERRTQRDCLIDVTARLVWEDDGVEVVETRATAWAGRDVLVEIGDLRYRLKGVWVAAEDVRRR